MATTDAISLSPKIKRHKQYTLVIPLDLHGDRVLLGYKLRGFGQGKYNGYGGKVEPNETVIAAAVRELHEESGLLVEEPAMIQRGVLLLETVADDTSPILEIHVFTVETWEGTETATDEMTPHWFSLSKSLTAPTKSTPVSGSIPPSFLSTSSAAEAGGVEESQPHPGGPHDLPVIPYFQMWEESRVWLPHLLRHVSSSEEGRGGVGGNLISPEPSPPAATAASDGDRNETENKGKKYFIHHVQFIGGTDMDAVDGGEYSVWHGMGPRRLDWVDELPIGEWEGRKSFKTYP
ncbi:Nudix (Nucleoside diphosphate linked moiety X)-type motif 1 [Arthrobotrys megalospora]